MYQIKYKNQNQPIIFHFYRQKEHICVTLSNNHKIGKIGPTGNVADEKGKKNSILV